MAWQSASLVDALCTALEGMGALHHGLLEPFLPRVYHFIFAVLTSTDATPASHTAVMNLSQGITLTSTDATPSSHTAVMNLSQNITSTYLTLSQLTELVDAIMLALRNPLPTNVISSSVVSTGAATPNVALKKRKSDVLAVAAAATAAGSDLVMTTAVDASLLVGWHHGAVRSWPQQLASLSDQHVTGLLQRFNDELTAVYVCLKSICALTYFILNFVMSVWPSGCMTC